MEIETLSGLETFVALAFLTGFIATNLAIVMYLVIRRSDDCVSTFVPCLPGGHYWIVGQATALFQGYGYHVEWASENQGSFAKRSGGSIALAVLLMFFFLIPGVLYFLFAAHEEHGYISAAPWGNGCYVNIDGPRYIVRELEKSLGIKQIN
jgi:hypothetical protein